MQPAKHRVTLDRERALVYDFGAWRELERVTGFSFLKEGLKIDRFEETEFFLQCLRAGLLREDPTVTIEDIDGFEYARASEILETMIEAILASLGDSKEKAPQGDPLPAIDPRKTSG